MVVRSLTELQNLVKRDPSGYYNEIDQQISHFNSIYDILKSTGSVGTHRQHKDFVELINFLSHCAKLFKKRCAKFPKQLLDLITKHGEKLDPQLRLGVVKALILVRNRDVIGPMFILPSFFQLFCIQDKTLRKLIFFHIVNDIARVNKKRQNLKLNKKLQNYIFSLLKNDNSTVVRKSLGVVMELFRKQVWQDAKTVSVVGECCFSKHSQVLRNGLHFFMGDALPVMEEDTLEQRIKRQVKVNTKRKRKRLIKLARLQEKLEDKKEEQGVTDTHDIQAIRSIDDPQTFAERLFSAVKRSKEKWDIKVLYVGVISRIIAHHQVLLFSFYAFLQNYLTPSQRDVTKLLIYAAQATHRLVPPEVLEPFVKYIADRFVAQRSSPEAIAAGINTIRAICARQPECISADLLQDITLYKKHTDRGVHVAAKSLIHVFQLERPELLHKKDQGKWKHMAYRLEYGEQRVADTVKGVDLLMEARGIKGKPEDLLTTQFLDDDDIEEIRLLRIKQIAEKHQVREDQVELKSDGEQGEELDEDDIKGTTQLAREAHEFRIKNKGNTSTGAKDWRDYMKELGGTGTNEESARHKPFKMTQKAEKVSRKRMRGVREEAQLRGKLANKRKKINTHKIKRRQN